MVCSICNKNDLNNIEIPCILSLPEYHILYTIYHMKPKHIAIIPDGNRRWAVENGKQKIEGHTEGAKRIGDVAKAALTEGIECITMWIYSTENLQRSKLEVAHLMLLSTQITKYLPDMHENNIRVEFAGDLERLPKAVQKSFAKVTQETKDNSALTLTFAAAYGGRDDIVRATKRIIEDGIKAEDITEDLFSTYVDLAHLPTIDLVIRTGNKKRLSGFFPWQITYSELYFTDLFWPAFDGDELKKAITWFEDQVRTKGK